MSMSGNTKKDTPDKPTCPRCKRNIFVRKHDLKNGEQRYRCRKTGRGDGCGAVFSLPIPYSSPFKNPKQKSIEQYEKEVEIIFVWLSDNQTISKVARDLKTTVYYVKKTIKSIFGGLFTDDDENSPIKSFAEVRKNLRHDRITGYKRDDDFYFLKSVWSNNIRNIPYLFGLTEPEMKEKIEKKYGIILSYKLLSKIISAEEPAAEKDVEQLLNDYRILFDWMELSSHKLSAIARKNGVSTIYAGNLIRERFKNVYLDLEPHRSYRGFIKAARENYALLRKYAEDYAHGLNNYQLRCLQFAYVLFDPASDFAKVVYRTKSEIIKEYTADYDEPTFVNAIESVALHYKAVNDERWDNDKRRKGHQRWKKRRQLESETEQNCKTET